MWSQMAQIILQMFAHVNLKQTLKLNEHLRSSHAQEMPTQSNKNTHHRKRSTKFPPPVRDKNKMVESRTVQLVMKNSPFSACSFEISLTWSLFQYFLSFRELRLL
jgi:hypothetical protein